MIVGFRRWRVHDQALWPLVKTSAGPWHPFPERQPASKCYCLRYGLLMESMALSVMPLRCPHPVLSGKCGYYLHRYPLLPCWCPDPFTPAHPFIIGVVRGWGKMVEHSEGWRVERAEIIGIVDKAELVHPDYNVTRYPDLETMYAEWAPDADRWACDEISWSDEHPLHDMRDMPILYGNCVHHEVIGNVYVKRNGSYREMREYARVLFEVIDTRTAQDPEEPPFIRWISG